jgi:multiple sugar transport system permease protein
MTKLLRILRSTLLHAMMYGLALITVAPFLWMVLTSFKEIGDIFTYPPNWWPKAFVLDNYISAFSAAPFGRYYFNSVFVAVAVTLGQIVTCSMAAFAFARLKFPGREVLFYIFLGTMMIPGQVTMIPSFMMLHWLGWVDKYQALIVPGLASAFGTFLLRQFFLTIPRDLDEAAMIDGASPFRVLVSVIIPQSWPAITAVGLFHFFWAWNDFFNPLIYLSSKPDLQPISVGLQQFNATFGQQPHLIQAGSLMALLLPVVIFFFAQRLFMQGVVVTGVEK